MTESFRDRANAQLALRYAAQTAELKPIAELLVQQGWTKDTKDPEVFRLTLAEGKTAHYYKLWIEPAKLRATLDKQIANSGVIGVATQNIDTMAPKEIVRGLHNTILKDLKLKTSEV